MTAKRDEPLSATKRTTVMRRPWSLVANRYIFVHSASCLMQYTFLYLFILYCIMWLGAFTVLAGWQEGHLACNNLALATPIRFFKRPFLGTLLNWRWERTHNFGFVFHSGSFMIRVRFYSGSEYFEKLGLCVSLSCVNIQFGLVLGKPGFWFGYQKCPEFLLWKTYWTHSLTWRNVQKEQTHQLSKIKRNLWN